LGYLITFDAGDIIMMAANINAKAVVRVMGSGRQNPSSEAILAEFDGFCAKSS
jgi:hypothetical protein